LLDPLHDVDQMLLLLQWARRSPSTVVLEITEREGVNDLPRFRQVLASYRQAGFRFAMDDVGEGHSTLEILAAGAPEFIKIANSLTRSADQPGPRAAVEALVTFAQSAGATVIAEGIESQADLDRMMELGAELGQGFLLGHPTVGGVHPSIATPTAGTIAQ
ncbi:MAG: EAL domain-containing protein, partial [Candidatus Dormibacteraeota bacterium]|nr:EAL domain-containing protein [Candidatus Dormibacteraeota bacterium]